MSYHPQTSFPKTKLPNGVEIFCLKKEEVFLIYEQVQEYFKHGIELSEGDTVFDVGANIGMFALWVAQLCNRKVNVYCFEPLPEVFQVLEQNIKYLNLSENIEVLPFGISQHSKLQTFSYHPNATALSTAYPDGSVAERRKFKRAALQKIANLKNNPESSSPLHWYTKIPQFLLSAIIDWKINRAFLVQQVICQLKTLSEVIRESRVNKIDLLKIDVEKSELDVLLGIEENDWSKIKQIVLEVHDLEHRLEQIVSLLKSEGFSKVVVEQEAYLLGTDIFNVYALQKNSTNKSD